VLWPGPSQENAAARASKVHLVPGARPWLGLERIEAVRKIIFGLAKYVPDFVRPATTIP
jgi:hypothetical protein